MARPPGVSEFMVVPETVSYRDPLAPNEREIFVRIATTPKISVAELSAQATLAPEIISRIVKKLLALKWILERVDEKDRRVKRIGMTRTGYQSLRDHFSNQQGKKITHVLGVFVWDGENDPLELGAQESGPK